MPAESIHKDNTVTLDQLSEVLDSGAVIQAKNLLNSLYPSEIADVIESTPRNRRDLLWTLVSDENKGETLAELNDEVREYLIDELIDRDGTEGLVKIAEKLDTGPVCNAYKIDLKNDLNASDVADKISLIAAEKILDNIDNILEDKANFIEQDHSKATYAPKIQKIEGEINWKNNSKNIIGKINGLYPVPGAFFIYNGERYKILKAEAGNGIGKPVEVISDYLEIACGDKQSIKIKEIQRQGKKPQNIGEFMLGSQIKKGIIV